MGQLEQIQTSDSQKLPTVSIFMAIRNEGKTIEKCFSSFIGQTYPLNKIEIIIANKSEDETDAVLKKVIVEHPDNIKVIYNPSGKTVDGLNLSLAKTTGEIVILYIGHAYPARDFLVNIVDEFTSNHFTMACGQVIPVSRSGKRASVAIALALQHQYTIGSNSFTLKKRQQVKSMHWMAVSRSLIKKVGGFNPKYSPRGEDCDWYERLIENGGKAVFEPSIISYYFVRETFSAQFMIQCKNGYYRMQPFMNSGRGVRARHLLPIVLISLVLIFSIITKNASILLFSGLFYLLTTSFVALSICRKKLLSWPMVVWAIVLIHAGHCIGIVIGILWFMPQMSGIRLNRYFKHSNLRADNNERSVD